MATAILVKSVEETKKGRVEEEQAVQMLTLECAVYLCLPLHTENGSSSMWELIGTMMGMNLVTCWGSIPSLPQPREGLLDGVLPFTGLNIFKFSF